MFGKKFQRKYALTAQGVQTVKKGTFWTVIVNLIVLGGISILYLLMDGFMGALTEGEPLPNAALFITGVLLFLLLSFATHLQQYRATYGLVYNEVKATRLSLAERLRKLPLGYFGKRDLADLTETLMGDVNRMEHVWSHVLGYLYGAYISTGVAAVCLFVYDWRLAAACLWGGRRRLACCSAAAGSRDAAPSGRKKPPSAWRMGCRRRWRTSARSAPPTSRRVTSQNWGRRSTNMSGSRSAANYPPAFW